MTGASPEEVGRTPIDLPLDGGGTTFIEASAGTGKTYALTTLVARLVVEEGRSLDRILVVTFARATVAELRDRIRRTLGRTLAVVKAHVAELESGTPKTDGAAPTDTPTGLAPPRVPELDPRARETDAAAPAGAPTGAASSRPGEMRSPAAGPDASMDGTDPQASELLARWERTEGIELAEAVRRLETAMRDIDRASVYSIHGFCRRVLADLAFESGFPFGFEVGGDDAEMVAGAVRDFWRRRLYRASPLLVRHAREREFLPGPLAEWVSARRPKSGVAVLTGGERPPEALEAQEARWRDVFEAAREAWNRHRDAFRDVVLNGQWLNRRSYSRSVVDEELDRIEAIFATPDPRLPGEGMAGRYGEAKLSTACKKGHRLPESPLFDAFDRLEEATAVLRSVFDQWLRWARQEVLTEVRGSIRRRVREERRLGYDDLLIELREALRRAEGKRLADRIRREFPCALIDEFQDTDPLQAHIFASVYGEVRSGIYSECASAGNAAPGAGAETDSADAGAEADSAGTGAEPARPGTFIVVGDPKQSIYRFRGADVFAYLAIRRTARRCLRLGHSWRSVPALVGAVNAVFAGARPFVIPEIEYRPVAAARGGGNPLRTAAGEDGGPLQFRLIPGTGNGKPRTKESAKQTVADATAAEIAGLLTLAARGEATIGDDPFTGGDIAVLVRTREQGRLIAGVLRERGVRSVEIDDGSVFGTREAERVERLLWALAEPGRESRVRGAIAGDLLGLDARALLAAGEDERVWARWMARLDDWRSEWVSKGIGAVLLRLLEGEGGAEHLLGYWDGARRLTNVRHLAELLQEAETRERLAPAELAAWLSHRRAAPGQAGDSAQLRLESDEQLVRILTMHGAKGLEFPVVFCPFAWDARSPGRSSGAVDAVYHREGEAGDCREALDLHPDGAAGDCREVLDLHPDAQAKAREWLEEFSESVRLFYVALTRAKYRCVVAWGQVQGAGYAPLAWLLHRSGAGPAGTPAPGSAPDAGDGRDPALAGIKAAADRFMGLNPSRWCDEVEAYARRFPDAVSVTRIETDTPPAPVAVAPGVRGASSPALAAREFGRLLRRTRTLTSFSALSAEAFAVADGAGRWPVRRDDPGADRPDHDQREAPAGGEGEEADAAGAAGRARTVFTFPRGPVAGECLHRIFERLDAPSGSGPAPPDLDAICRELLDDFGIDREWRPVARSMVESARAVWLREPVRGGPGEGGSLDESTGSGGQAGVGEQIGSGERAGSGSKAVWLREPVRGEPGEGDGSDESTGSGGQAGVGEQIGPGERAGSGSKAVWLREPVRGEPGEGGDPAERAGSGEQAGGGERAGSGGEAGSDRKADPAGTTDSHETIDAGGTDGFRLSDPSPRLVELEFHFPVEGFDRDRLAARLVEHGYRDPFARPVRSGASGQPPIDGFLRGYVDLVIRHGERWYVLDYKSNWLGPRPEDYAPEALAGAMQAGGYVLQSLIYLVALHRYLAVRLPEYDYERHVGGAFYLFLRGIDPATGMHRGVYFDRPTPACIHALDECFGGSAA